MIGGEGVESLKMKAVAVITPQSIPLVRVVKGGIYPVIKVAFGWQTSEGAGTRAAVDRLV